VLLNTHTHMCEYIHVINLLQSTKQGNSIGYFTYVKTNT